MTMCLQPSEQTLRGLLREICLLFNPRDKQTIEMCGAYHGIHSGILFGSTVILEV